MRYAGTINTTFCDKTISWSKYMTARVVMFYPSVCLDVHVSLGLAGSPYAVCMCVHV